MLASPAHAESSWTAPHPTGSTLTTDGTAYYLYNKGARQFMVAGNDYGTQATFGSSTTLTATAKTSNSYYRFTTSYGSGTMLFYDGYWLYVDGNETNRGTACDFTVTGTGTGNAYTITSYTVGSGTYIGYNGAMGSSGERIQPALGSDAGENIEWLFVSAGDYSTYQATATEMWDLYNALVNAEEMGFTDEDAYTAAGTAYTSGNSTAESLASATAALLAAMEAVATPGDMTEVTSQYITDPNFTDGNSANKWYVGITGSGTAITASTSGWWLQNNAIYTNGDASLTGWFAEAWTWSATLSDNGVSQTLSSLPAGEYRLQADIMATWQADTSVQPSGVYLFAGSAQTEALTANGLPETYTLDFEVATEGSNVVIGVKTVSTNVNWAGADNFKLYYIGTQLNYDTYELEQLIEEARAILDESYNGYDALNTAISTAEGYLQSSSTTDIEAAIAALEEAIATYKTLNASKFDDAVGTEITITNPDASDGVNGWTTTTNVTTTYNQHWSDRSWRKYFEDGFGNYESTTPWEESMYQTVTITKAGVYKLTAAGRSSASAKTTLVAGDMEYVFPADGDTGGTIDVDGNTWPSVAAGIEAGATFAYNNLGRGWNWGSIEVIVGNEDISNGLTIGARFEHTSDAAYQYCSITDFKLEYIGTENATLDKDVLALTIADAQSIDITTNVGTTAFLRSKTLADALTAAIKEAQTVYGSSDATVEQIEAAIASLQEAVKAFDNAALNKPENGQAFNIVMVSSESSYTGYPVTFYTSESTEGGYNLGYVKADIDPNYGQAFTFTPATSENFTHDGYTISFVGVDGQTHYFCLGSNYYTYQLRTTTTANDAYVYQVVLLGEGVWGIYCPANSSYTGTDSGGLFHTNNNSEVEMTEAEGVTYTATFTPGDTGYATVCLPFAVNSLPTGVTACSPTVSGDEVVTTETVDALAANTPYLLSGTGDGTATFTGLGTYYDTYDLTNEALTGVIAEDEEAEKGVYVLQSHEGEVAFYLVTENSGDVTVPQYHAYLTADSGAGAKAEAFILVPGKTTGIEAVEAVEADSETIYDLSGRKVSKAQKGVYIKGGKKVIIK